MLERIQRFNRILKLRENDRQAEQVRLAEERREQDAIASKLETLGKEKLEAIDSFRRDGAEKTVSCQDIWLQRQTIDVIDKYIDKGKALFADAQRRIEQTEERLIERHRDVRMMEGYVDHLKTDAAKAFFDAEQDELDDMSMLRYLRA
ncbi:MAG: flagellar FliJ family protein [Synergistaceae bacterium]|jgi:flagellar export protein FliJ|nr:flagellar FliJ family protein [Synergistaceae bacterium]